MTYNLEKQDKNSKLGKPNFRLYLALLKDVDVENWPTATDATISTDVLKTGKKWNYVDATTESINPNTALGESPLNGVLTLSPFIEGISKKSLQWIYDNSAEDCIAVWERCADKQKFIGGSPCSGGLKISYTNIGKDDKGTAGIALQLQGQQCPEPFYFYDGPLEVEPDVNP